VEVFEKGDVAEHVRRWGHVQMFSPFHQNASPLGLAALAAQDTDYRPPSPEDYLTGAMFRQTYLLPLSQSDLLADSICTGVRVAGVAREGFRRQDQLGQAERSTAPFRLLVEDRQGRQRYATADVVIDATGCWGQPQGCGPGGLPARGERQLAGQIDYHVPDVLGTQRAGFSERHTLVVGSHFSAAATVVLLAELAAASPGTQVTWVTREDRLSPAACGNPDACPGLRELAEAAYRLVSEEHPRVRHLGGTELDSIEQADGGALRIQFTGQNSATLIVDRVVANVGYGPDSQILSELQLEFTADTEAPRHAHNAI